jgi:hypothetical protein
VVNPLLRNKYATLIICSKGRSIKISKVLMGLTSEYLYIVSQQTINWFVLDHKVKHVLLEYLYSHLVFHILTISASWISIPLDEHFKTP